MFFLTPQQILFIHYRLIESTGGVHGVRDVGALQAAAARPHATFDGEDLYTDPFSKAAALMESIIKNHPFLDGNKRTAITSASILLRRYGYSVESSQEDLYSFTMNMATGVATAKAAELWFRSHAARL
jgi:death-on-curing protein